MLLTQGQAAHPRLLYLAGTLWHAGKMFVD